MADEKSRGNWYCTGDPPEGMSWFGGAVNNIDPSVYAGHCTANGQEPRCQVGSFAAPGLVRMRGPHEDSVCSQHLTILRPLLQKVL